MIGLPVLLRRVERVEGQLHVRGVPADLVEGGEPRVPVEGGVLQRLGRNRGGKLLEPPHRLRGERVTTPPALRASSANRSNSVLVSDSARSPSNISMPNTLRAYSAPIQVCGMSPR